MTLSISYLESLRVKIIQELKDPKAKKIFSGLSPNDIFELQRSTSPNSVAKKTRLTTRQCNNIVEVIQIFKENHGVYPSEIPNPHPPVLDVPVSPNAFNFSDELIHELTLISEKFLKGSPAVDLSKAAVLAQKINPQFQTALSKAELKTAGGGDEWYTFFDEILSHVLIPINHLILFEPECGSDIQKYSAIIQPNSWRLRSKYLGLPVWLASVKRKEGFKIGTTFQNIAFVDPGISEKDAYPLYLQLMGGDRANPFFNQLVTYLIKFRMGIKDYGHYFGTVRSEYEQVEYAKIRNYLRLYAKKKQIKQSAFYGSSLDIDALLKDNASIHKFIVPGKSSWTFQNVINSVAVRSLAAKTGGIITEMGKHLEDGNNDLAYMAFLDFMGTNDLRVETYKDKIADIPPLAKAETISSMFLFFIFSEMGLTSSDEILAECQSGKKDPILKALEILRESRALSLRGENEIEMFLGIQS